MKLKLSLLIFFSGLILSAQTFKDSVFEKAIAIDKENTAHFGKDFLVDVVVPENIVKISFLNNNPELPNAVLCNSRDFFSHIKEFFVISRDWDYYRKISESNNKEPERHLRPIIRFKYFHVKRNADNVAKIDSFAIDYKQPELKLIKPEYYYSKQIKVFHTENYGSICCPRDLLWDNNPGIAEFVVAFEKEKNANAKPYYSKGFGKEGEIAFYFPLEHLTLKQKLEFIVERLASTVINQERKDYIATDPRVFTPNLKDRKNFERTID
ncbi:hypothetical protein FNO01nite_22260 [Flavobacterium noncentrifugens]|uniref:GLPGLI family protein n=1 Tax=Flavobacterium noncentrifugens TaxID=1128970 RepID=A0A1G9AQY6_9FLAO|nr:hypothetical protein [Flavobacterium noncentrifugens]GEP51554.1 hypothetical protein FNO01nite_22260 [Flavobacterium noncentrifugens]SDK29776.1 hypothetical protein SAMN04487935_3016 [Flavobacterium noncentrifugens]